MIGNVGEEKRMLTNEERNKVDKIWETFWTGGITNPLEVIEQFTYLLFIKQLDEVETRHEADSNLLGITYDKKIFGADQQKYRWNNFKNIGDAEKMFAMVRGGFPIHQKTSPRRRFCILQIYG